jgi:PKD repeat protein
LLHVATLTSTSTDSDGTIVSSVWDFGDGTSGTGPTPQHTYAAPGTYPVTLTVTDNSGASSSITQPVTITNATPSASFTSSVSYTTASFTSTSTDADGTVVSYLWNFGDGTTATGATTTHVYAAGGTYNVTLTATDNDGGSSATVGTIMATDLWAADTFTRTVANGLGTADTGGAWTLSGTAANFSANGTVGKILGTVNANRAAYLGSVRQTDIEIRADLALDTAATGGGTYASVIGRRVSNGNHYAFKIRYLAGGTIAAFITRSVGGVETTLASTNVTGLAVNPGDVLKVRFQIAGTNPTVLVAKVWRASGAEPAAWTVNATDSTAALASAGDIGFLHYVSSSWTGAVPTLSIDNLVATPPLAG